MSTEEVLFYLWPILFAVSAMPAIIGIHSKHKRICFRKLQKNKRLLRHPQQRTAGRDKTLPSDHTPTTGGRQTAYDQDRPWAGALEYFMEDRP